MKKYISPTLLTLSIAILFSGCHSENKLSGNGFSKRRYMKGIYIPKIDEPICATNKAVKHPINPPVKENNYSKSDSTYANVSENLLASTKKLTGFVISKKTMKPELPILLNKLKYVPQDTTKNNIQKKRKISENLKGAAPSIAAVLLGVIATLFIITAIAQASLGLLFFALPFAIAAIVCVATATKSNKQKKGKNPENLKSATPSIVAISLIGFALISGLVYPPLSILIFLSAIAAIVLGAIGMRKNRKAHVLGLIAMILGILITLLYLIEIALFIGFLFGLI